ncbi:YkgJ family cysteine cluster protein [Vibrio mediterranei]|uniref:YkgJ family cysteine cluster protein n=1 Tax=Vibrio mediterranei TaxID=689 RepID=UPI004067B806
MMKRNVKPEDEIPSCFLTDEAQKARAEALTNRELAEVSQKALREAFSLFEGPNIDVEMFQRFYSLLDIYTSHELAPFSCCARGCGQCCHVPVSVSLPEAMYLSHHLNRELNLHPTQKHHEYDGTPCPFLGEDGACSVYEARPIACRLFYAVDHYKYCYERKPHRILTMASQPNLFRLQKWLSEVSDGTYAAGGYDIREWFK